jgi:putative oxygen-independent coproporphyrinogen III oxidase
MIRNLIPLSLYIHIPWCVRKCPYCDFNSHALNKEKYDEEAYINTLIADFRESLKYTYNRPLHSIFFGGGTPSLFKPESYERLFKAIFELVDVEDNLEITLEANPGTVDMPYFKGYREIGINRISLGIQSFDPEKLKQLGRIHSAEQAKNAFYMAREAGFDNINLDLMFGLPNQTLEEALLDLQQAIELKPEHLSWYQLTLEPNTVFYKQPPKLPNEDKLWEIEQQGKALIAPYYQQYEISAYSKTNRQARHNLNYWLFGDYIGIGAGAHGKITVIEDNIFKIHRSQKKRQPTDYMNPEKTRVAKEWCVPSEEVAFEFMLNALRLYQAIPYELMTSRTGMPLEQFQKKLIKAPKKGLLRLNQDSLEVTALGHQYLNNLQESFL